jgi:hypothetical protein
LAIKPLPWQLNLFECFEFREFPKRGSTPFFESAKRLERLELSVVVERLERAALVSERLNALNVWNGLE